MNYNLVGFSSEELADMYKRIQLLEGEEYNDRRQDILDILSTRGYPL